MKVRGVVAGAVGAAVLLLVFSGEREQEPSPSTRVRTVATTTTETSLIPPIVESTTTLPPTTTTTAPPPTTTSPPRTTTTHPSRSYQRPQVDPPPVEAAAPDAESTCRAAAAKRKGERVAGVVAQWTSLVVRYFPNEVAKACGVMACESEGNPNAVGPRQPNGTHPHGLMQILDGPFDPEANVRLAASMRAKRGWQPWSCA